MFPSLNLKQLKQILKDFKEHHNIRNYHKLKKSDLLNELDKRFEIDGGYLYLKGGTAKNAGYVRRMEAENKIEFDKIHNPSKYMIDKYGNKHAEPEYHPEPDFHYEPAPQDAHDTPLFKDDEQVDFNVGKKPKKKNNKNKQPTEAQEESADLEKQKELENKHKLMQELESLIKEIVECKKLLGQEDTKYHNAREELQKKRWKKSEKEEIEQTLGINWRKNRQKIKSKYKNVINYVQKHKLNEDNLSDAHKHINAEMKKL
jgi:hypothetical protein